jgi:hypothetical protein
MTFPPNSQEPRREIRVVQHAPTGQLYERDDFNLWHPAGGAVVSSYLWEELNHRNVSTGDTALGQTYPGQELALVEIMMFTWETGKTSKAAV